MAKRNYLMQTSKFRLIAQIVAALLLLSLALLASAQPKKPSAPPAGAPLLLLPGSPLDLILAAPGAAHHRSMKLQWDLPALNWQTRACPLVPNTCRRDGLWTTRVWCKPDATFSPSALRARRWDWLSSAVTIAPGGRKTATCAGTTGAKTSRSTHRTGNRHSTFRLRAHPA